MEFNRFGQSRQANTPAASAPATSKPASVNAPQVPRQQGPSHEHSRLHRWSFIALLLSGTVLFIAMIFFIVFGTPVNREERYVEADKYQAVFVNVNGTNGGQVYFGKVTSMTPQYIRLTNVFYIQNQAQDGSQTESAYNLVKLGCELHGPTDEMLINRDQVFFWENLKADSQVAQKAAEFYKQNPEGQKCSDTTNSTQQSTTNTQTPSGTTTPPANSGTTGNDANKPDTDTSANP